MDKQNKFEMTDTRYPASPPYPGGSGFQPHQPPYSNPPPYTEHQIVGPPVQTTVITTSPTIVMINNLGPNATSCFCTACNKQVVTAVKKETTLRTHLLAGILCLFGCWCCVCIPYCVDSLKKSFHYCPQCNAYLGSST
ncbi:unnamed protein product [Pieris macdunnoughi]|uniref:LITAF domain-containing protein n=1 Tax=Pieris macdunnoughi TaxID=345717 RepID=A0A821UU67_9NEOP|nr:unnamed protein product [Pieris macdunnoughi]